MWRAPQQMCYKNSLVSPVPHTCPQKAIIYHAELEEIPKKVREEKRNSHHNLTVCVPASKHILDRFQAYKQQRCLVVVVHSFTDKLWLIGCRSQHSASKTYPNILRGVTFHLGFLHISSLRALLWSHIYTWPVYCAVKHTVGCLPL